MAKWIITSAWPYSSDVPHLGNLIGSVLSADVMARYLRMNGHSVIMVSGSDEHGTPVEIEALKRNIPVREFADRNHKIISELFKKWNISFDNYTRTESPVHIKFVQEHYKRIYENGYIFTKDEYIHYCPNDKKFLPDRFVEGICPYCNAIGARGDQCENCGKPLQADQLINPYCTICHGPTEIRKTKQWFFDLPKLSDEIKHYILNNKNLSENVVKFSLSWIEEGLQPRSITRDTSWGIPAPFEGAEGKTIYVWMEAVLGYISAVIEYFKNRGEEEKWKDYWLDHNTKTAFFIGKDNIPFHSVIFTGLLLASKQNYTLPTVISATEFLQFEGKKFSKSKRIGIWIDEALEILPADYWRYTLLSIRPEGGDVNFTYDLLEEKVNSELNDKIGNFVQRTLSAIQRFMNGEIPYKPELNDENKRELEIIHEIHNKITQCYEAFEIQKAVKLTLSQAEEGNRYLNATEPWKLFQINKKAGEAVLYIAARIVKALAIELYPIIPNTSCEILRFLNIKDCNPKWLDAISDFSFPLKIGSFKPLFTKIKKEEIINRLNRIRSRGDGK
ncbi:MAG: methionine--tRNA ligase [Nitrososphaerales archaeon]